MNSVCATLGKQQKIVQQLKQATDRLKTTWIMECSLQLMDVAVDVFMPQADR